MYGQISFQQDTKNCFTNSPEANQAEGVIIGVYKGDGDDPGL